MNKEQINDLRKECVELGHLGSTASRLVLDSHEAKQEEIDELEVFAEYLAQASCRCQMCAPDVNANAHYDCCMVGRAQKYLKQKVTSKAVYGH
jgi:hypothetical protein